jgi:hypothetical protein
MPARKAVAEEESEVLGGQARVTLTLVAPPAAQYEKGAMLTFRGDSLAEVVGLAEGLFDDLQNQMSVVFNLNRAESKVLNEPNVPEEEEERPAPRARVTGRKLARRTSSRRQGSPAAEVVEEGGCPEDGGDLVRRERRDGSGSFVGCANFPDCNYIENN